MINRAPVAFTVHHLVQLCTGCRPHLLREGLHRKGAAEVPGEVHWAGDRRCDRRWNPPNLVILYSYSPEAVGKPPSQNDTSLSAMAGPRGLSRVRGAAAPC
ncbi:hypothetical protein GCM10018987_17540 [Streptomyces cremeus]